MDIWLVLAQVLPTDPNQPWMWATGVLTAAVVALFGLYTAKILGNEKEWKATAQEATVQFPKTQATIEKAVDALRVQQTLIETQVRDISQLKDTVVRVERHLDDLRTTLPAVIPRSRQRPEGE